MQSCLYQGSVFHARRHPVTHRFRYAVAMAYLDLDETSALLKSSWVASNRKWSLLSFDAKDHSLTPGGSSANEVDEPANLATQVREHVEQETGGACLGPIRLLTQFRQLGCYFSPLNLFYCFADDGDPVPQAIVAEVSNTPWNERRLYLLHGANRLGGAGRSLRYRHSKDFHVSPFMGLDASYDWRLSVPDEQLRVRIRSTAGAGPPFDAAMSLQRRPWSDRALAAMLRRFPAASVQTLAAIYWQAFRLWRKRCPFHPHPNSIPAAA